MPPAKLSQPRHQPLQQVGGIRVGAPRSACRVGHVVLGGVAEQRHALASRMGPRQPAGERLAGGTRPDLLTAPDEFLERERPRPCPGCGGHGIPEIFPGHRQHEGGQGQVRGAATRLRCAAVSIPYEAMTEMTSGCGGSPERIIPAERTGVVTPSAASRRASSGAAIADRHTFAVHSTRMPASAGVSRCVRAAGICAMSSSSVHLDITENCSSSAFRRAPAELSATEHRAGCEHRFYLSRACRTLISHSAFRGNGTPAGISGPLRSRGTSDR